MTIDGVIQNEEADGDGFKYGGWFFPYADEVTGAVVQERLAKPVDLLLGRKTFAGWETYWPTHSFGRNGRFYGFSEGVDELSRDARNL